MMRTQRELPRISVREPLFLFRSGRNAFVPGFALLLLPFRPADLALGGVLYPREQLSGYGQSVPARHAAFSPLGEIRSSAKRSLAPSYEALRRLSAVPVSMSPTAIAASSKNAVK